MRRTVSKLLRKAAVEANPHLAHELYKAMKRDWKRTPRDKKAAFKEAL